MARDFVRHDQVVITSNTFDLLVEKEANVNTSNTFEFLVEKEEKNKGHMPDNNGQRANKEINQQRTPTKLWVSKFLERDKIT